MSSLPSSSQQLDPTSLPAALRSHGELTRTYQASILPEDNQTKSVPVKREGLGYGADLSVPQAPDFLEQMHGMQAHVHESKQIPLDAHHSQSFQVDKNNNKSGCASLRLVHSLCAYWRGFFKAGVLKLTKEKIWPRWA